MDEIYNKIRAIDSELATYEQRELKMAQPGLFTQLIMANMPDPAVVTTAVVDPKNMPLNRIMNGSTAYMELSRRAMEHAKLLGNQEGEALVARLTIDLRRTAREVAQLQELRRRQLQNIDGLTQKEAEYMLQQLMSGKWTMRPTTEQLFLGEYKIDTGTEKRFGDLWTQYE